MNIDKLRANLIDISPCVSEDSAVFPGDQPMRLIRRKQFGQEGTYLLVSSITSTLHVGAHADAPIHYDCAGKSIDDVDLWRYLGKCEVIAAAPKCPLGLLTEGDLPTIAPGTQRVLFRTDSVNDDTLWQQQFTALSAGLVGALAKAGVVLVGIDTPSIDPANSLDLSAHRAISTNGMSILEGLDLHKVTPGSYDLIALPLRLCGADASPVRAILLPPGTFTN